MKPRRFCSHSSEQDITNLSLAQKAGANILSAAASCRIDSLESAGDASSPAAVEARCWEAPKGIDAEAHRYPHCLVWTPIPLLSWLCPYIGHVGLCDSEGRVLDFAGPFYVGIDSMLFDWPTRYIQLHLDDAQLEQTKSWDQAVFEVATDFEGQSYDFVCWNCHSFLASFLNRLNYGPDVCARLLHGWTVAGVAARLFVSARFVNFWGFVKTWGGNLAIWTAVLLSTLLSNSYALLEAWVWVLATTNLLFISWFLALTALGARSQWGLLRHSRDGDSAAEMRDPDAMLTQVGLSRRQRSSSSSEISVRL
uniref:Uncharacterized protein n=1 Tax=Chrysotila carterae TaxID=13221 RepID=A0A7S4EVU1_CHRCT|mmetsp:Transcript_12834/g.27689  ORF Transcript_12834/g.27689 Transcript_12834/m.27689 type:complete len:309 (-) Transcript_12834:346-1272(-)